MTEAPLLLGMGRLSEQPGGLNRYVHDLVAALEDAGARPTLVVAAPGASLPRRISAVTRAAAASARDATVVDSHFALYSFVPVVLGSLRRRPLVVHFHGPWADETAAAGDGSRLRRALRRRVERAVYWRAQSVVVLSRAFGRVVVERYGVSPWRVAVVPPGVDLERFSPGDRDAARARLGLPADGLVAVTVRRLVPRMGVDVLLDAWAKMPRGSMLLVVGDGPLRDGLEEQARSLGLADAVVFRGRVDEEELVACYCAADVCVVPSRTLEGFGLTALEALACGTPVVGSDSGGLPEVLAPLDPRTVVPAGDATALAGRLSAPSQLPARDDCRRYAGTFSWKRAAKAHLDLYARARAGVDDGRRPRVVFLDHTARLSGGELALLRLLPALDVNAHVVLAEDGPLANRLSAAGISVEVLPLAEPARTMKRHTSGVRRLAALPATVLYVAQLARHLRRVAPDIVHTNSLKSALYGGVAARLAGVPVVWHVRDRIAEDYLSPASVRLVRAAARRLPRAVIANSAATLETLGDLRVPAHVVASPVAAASAERAHRGGPLRVGMVGRIARWKGQHVFVEAFARAFPEGDERGVIVGAPLFGTDEERYFDELAALVGTHGLQERLELAGFREDVPAELASFDVFVHASVVPEPFGQVVVEAMAHGLPVLAAHAGGPAEVITDGVDGILYAPGDVDALAAALRRAADSPDLRRQLGDRARETARAFTPERVAEQVRQVYAEVLGQ